MNNSSVLSRRFAELRDQLDKVEATKKHQNGAYISGLFVDTEAFTNWKAKARHLVSVACGQESVHFKDFLHREKGSGYSTNHDILLQVRAVFDAAREDFDAGMFTSVRNMVQAEVFSSELDQASELLRSGYETAAAVVAGVVLETTMRRLCDDAGLQPGSLNKMNADLTKASVYSLLVNKRITALADIRNNAAHGHPEKFDKADVEDMIQKVEAFVADHL